jgi:hypothetical protein
VEASKEMQELFDRLVPVSGNAGTIEGEMVRAFNKIAYRYFNDGDLPTVGYGVETSGPCLVFLQSSLVPKAIRLIAKELEVISGNLIEKFSKNDPFWKKLVEMEQEIVNIVVPNIDSLTKSDVDMLNKEFRDKALYKWDEDELEDEWYAW